jgi:hypothetical protein
VDIEIPDDARELDRDVQAYHRELRALRRHRRRTRWHRSLGKDGIMLPLLACCLILALIAGTLLTVFTATSEQGLTGSGLGPGSALSTGNGGPAPHIVGATLRPRAEIAVYGNQHIRLDTLQRAMLVLVPQSCDCTSTLEWLVAVANRVNARAYMVYDQASEGEANLLWGQLELPQREVLTPAVAFGRLLTNPADLPAAQLTAILVTRGTTGQADPTVQYASGLSPSDNATPLLHAITAEHGTTGG